MRGTKQSILTVLGRSGWLQPPGFLLQSLLITAKDFRCNPLKEILKNIWYTTNENEFIIPYNKFHEPDGSSMSDAKIMVLAAHIALGFEFKIFKFLSGQIAVGSGYYWVKPKPDMQLPKTYPYGNVGLDVFNKENKNNLYQNHFGFDWYARLGLAWRIYNF